MAQTMDWHDWHTAYDDPASSLSQRLAAVRAELARVLELRRGAPTQLVSICAGDGRDTLPVLAAGHADVRSVLVELDPALADTARREAARLELTAVDVRIGDAGSVDTLADVPPADVFIACGVFGNISDDDLVTTVGTLPQLIAPNAAVIWTRGRPLGDPTRFRGGEPVEMVREVFARHDFVEESFVRPQDADFRVGVHRFAGTPQQRVPGVRMFRFVR